VEVLHPEQIGIEFQDVELWIDAFNVDPDRERRQRESGQSLGMAQGDMEPASAHNRLATDISHDRAAGQHAIE